MEYDKKFMKSMAKNFKNYLDIVDRYVIIDGLTKKEYKEAKKQMKKLIKHLKNGEGDKVFDRDRYLEMMESGLTHHD